MLCFSPFYFLLQAIASGNMRLQLAFLASLHSVAPGMDKGSAGDAASDSVGAGGAGAGAGSAPSKPVRVDVAEMEAELADLIKEEADAEGESRESRTMKQWLNSLNLPRVYVHSLFQDSRDGVILLKALDHIEPGASSFAPGRVFPRLRGCTRAAVTPLSRV